MTRTAVGGLAAGTFLLGVLVGLGIPGTFPRADHDRLMADHMAAGAMMNSSMGPMMNMGSTMGQGLMGQGPMPMMPGSSAPAGHNAHHWPGPSR